MKRRHLQHTLGVTPIIFIAILGGALLYNANHFKTEFYGMVVPLVALFGAVVGLVTSPALLFAIWRKDWRISIFAIYIPSLTSAIITSTRFNSLHNIVWTYGIFVVACVLCRYLIPDAPPRADGQCFNCDYDTRGLEKGTKCPECGTTQPSSIIPNHLGVSRLVICILAFVLIPIAAIGYDHYFNPPDLPSSSLAELTKCLTTDNVNLHHNAAGELSRRGWMNISQLVDHKNANVRRAVAKAVKNVGHDNSVRVTTKYLTDEDKRVRMQAIWTLQFEHPALLPLLEERLQIEKDPLVLRALNETITAMKKK